MQYTVNILDHQFGPITYAHPSPLPRTKHKKGISSSCNYTIHKLWWMPIMDDDITNIENTINKVSIRLNIYI